MCIRDRIITEHTLSKDNSSIHKRDNIELKHVEVDSFPRIEEDEMYIQKYSTKEKKDRIELVKKEEIDIKKYEVI